MFIAHLGVGLAAKKVAPTASLGVLLVASQTLDILCGGFMLAGIERMRVSPGVTRMTPLEFLSFPWSHGLAMSLVWSILAALLAWRLFRAPRVGLVVGGLVFSHWVLDWISHRPDLPLFFDDSLKVGLGLWNSVPGTIAVECLLFAAGLWIVLNTTHAIDNTGRWSLAALAVFFPALFFLNHFGPQPPTDLPQQILAPFILIFIVVLPWGNWIEKHRGIRDKG